MLNCIQFVAHAENNDFTLLLNKIQINMAEEKDKVQKAIDDFNVKEYVFKNKQDFNNEALLKITNPNDLTYGTPYKVVSATRAIIEALIEGKKLEELVAEAPYYWEVPVLSRVSDQVVTSFIVAMVEGKWQVGAIGTSLTAEEMVFSGDANSIKTILQKNNLRNPKSLYHLRIESMHRDYLFLSSAGQEYFIPINPDTRTKVKAINKVITHADCSSANQERNVQTRDDVINQIGDRLRENIKNANSPYNIGGIGEPKNKTSIILYLILGFSAAVLLSHIVLHKRSIN